MPHKSFLNQVIVGFERTVVLGMAICSCSLAFAQAEKKSPPQTSGKSKAAQNKSEQPPQVSNEKPREELPVTGKFKNGNSDSYPRKPLENSGGYPQEQGHSYQYSYSYVIGTRNGVPVTRYGNAQATVTVNGQTQSVQSNSSGGRLGNIPTTEQLMRTKRNFVFDAGDKTVRVFHTPRLIRLRVKGKERRAKEKVYSARTLADLKKNDLEAYELYTRFLPGLPEDAKNANEKAGPSQGTSNLMNETLQKMEQTAKGAPIMSQILKDLKKQAKQ